jgi:5-methylcytosine-specific restriction enzyme A
MNAFTTTPRKSLTEPQRVKLFLERGGRCEECGVKIRQGTVWELDHALSLENGGTNDLDNLRILCRACHAAKTPGDRAKAAKTRAVAVRGIIPERHRKKSRLSKRENVRYDWQTGRYHFIDKCGGDDV